MKTLQVNGVLESEARREEKRADGGVKITNRRLIQVGVARGAAQALKLPVEETDVVRVELAGGFDLWIRADDLYQEFGVKTSRGIADPEAELWELSMEVPTRDDERGKIVKGIQALEVFGVDVVGGSAKTVAKWFEDKQLKKRDPGLYRCALASDFNLTPLDDKGVDNAGAMLLFIHGTASSTAGSFGKLWDAENQEGKKAREELATLYAERVYAFEHRSLTESPIANTLALVQQLPKGAELHVVTHSRGGLVGELLCLGQRDRKSEVLTAARIDELFANSMDLGELLGMVAAADTDKEYQQQRNDLQTLLRELDRKQLKVKRFVRVACPARGTTLASGRLDRWLSILSHLAGENPLFEEPVDFLLAVVKERTDPRTLPGLEAMMPGSPLVRMLNLPQLQVAADLSVIAGDLEGRSWWAKLKWLAADWFYSGDHDLVVNTGSMYGGLRRSGGARFFFDQGSDVNHFRYFTNERTVQKLVAGLIRSDQDAAGFSPIEKARHAEPARAPRAAPSGPRPLAVVLPGIMGSHLEVAGDRIWLDYGDLARGGLEDLAIEKRQVSPDQVFDDYYGALVEYLRRTHAVVPFPYDWRRSVLENGAALAQQLSEALPALEATRQPVHIVAHSLGGLVARAMLARHPGIWRRICALPGSRLLMLGTPNGGSHEIVRLLVGQAGTLIQLALLDLTHDRNELLEIINRFPGVLELLPTGDGMRCYTERFWREFKQDSVSSWPLPNASDLRSAAQSWEVLRSAPIDAERMLYVAGCARRTPADFEVASVPRFEVGGERKFVRFFSSRQGDGKVLWDTGRLPGVKTWYLDEVEHGDLAAHEAAFPAYLELLQTGATARLLATPPSGARGAAGEQLQVLAPDVPDSLPDEAQLMATVLGAGSRRVPGRVALPRTSVSVRHGSLAYARNPVCVGHYRGDTIVSAEGYLDSILDYRLSNRHQLDLYPGRLGTWESFINPDRYAKPGGAIVIGLGQVGELSPGSLEVSFSRALLGYALQVAEWPDARFGAAEGVPRSARVSALLIGTGFGGLTVRDCIESLLRGVKQANQRLQDTGLIDKVLIDEIEFLELWQDVAINAACQLEQALLDGDLAEHFVWRERRLEAGEGGQRRVQLEEAPNWWHRMEIIYDAKHQELRYVALTDRARAEESLVAGQMRLADDFIRTAIGKTGHDQEISRTLFEMLLPNRLKELAPHQYDLVIVVDEVSGRFPWELLEDRWSTCGRPLAVAAGLVRQLKTTEFRERPAYAAQDCAYVVGDPALPPPGAATMGVQFSALPGARAEAEAVAEYLGREGFRVDAQIGKDAGRIMQGLHADSYRVLHLAGHGVHEWPIEEKGGTVCPACEQPRPPQRKLVSGMVIGADVFLTPGDIEQMRWVPELVFINCCYLGSTASSSAPWQRFNRLAANIGAQFIRMGVKAVVAAGWAVDDDAAKTFALSFYAHLLSGDAFGDAVRAARDDTFTRHGETNTWGAYQCYGDPAYRLRPAKKGDGRGQRRCFTSPSQLAVALENLVAAARMGGAQLADIDAILDSVPQAYKSAWLQRPEVAAGLGLAFGELGNFEEAIKHLDRAISENKAEFPVRALEQRANFKSRWAVDLVLRGHQADAAKLATRLIREATRELKRLTQFAQTVERVSLLGSAYKRSAWISTGEARAEALQAMAGYYAKAHQATYQEGRGQLDTYPLLNWLVARVLLAFPDKPNDAALADILDWCRKAEVQAVEKEVQNPDFWNTVVKPDCDLLLGLATQTLDQDKQRIVDGYLRAKRRGASPREFRSVLEHLEFLADVTSGSKSKKAKAQLEALRDIKRQLQAHMAGESSQRPES